MSALFFKALGTRIARPWARWRNRLTARRACLGGRPEVAERLPEPILTGDADAGQALVSGRWTALGLDLAIAPGSIWDLRLPPGAFAPRLERERQACLWLDDLASLGSRPARVLAQAWVQDWIRHYGRGGGPGWTPELAGRRAKRWAAHAEMLTQGLDRTAADRFWRALAAHRRYLERVWRRAEPGRPRTRALIGLVWIGRVLPNRDHASLVAELGALADERIDAEGAIASRAPSELADLVTQLIWAARIIEDSGLKAGAPHLSAIARAVPVARSLRLGDGTLARFHGGDAGAPERLDQALAELRLGVQAKPRLAMGYARLIGGRVTLVMDAELPPGTGHAAALAFEMSIGRQPVVVNVGPGQGFGRDWSRFCRTTAAQSTVELDGRSSSRVEARDFAARTFGPRLVNGPTLVSVRQAQDATGMWLLGTHDGYASSHGLLHERRIFVDAKGREARGEELLTVTDAKARARFDQVSRRGPVVVAARFHLHPAVGVEFDAFRQAAILTLPSGETWMFRSGGGLLDIEESRVFDTHQPRAVPTKQMVVRAEVVEYLGQVTWSFGRVSEAKLSPDAGEGLDSP